MGKKQNSKLVTVEILNDIIQANVIKGLLIDQGFECHVCIDSSVSLNPFLPLIQSGYRIQVESSKADQALLLINAYIHELNNT